MVEFFLSFFQDLSRWGVVMALLFGAIWLLAYWPPVFQKLWLWAAMVGGAVLTLAAISFVQIPLQSLAGQVMVAVWGQTAVVQAILLTGILATLISGLVQEGAKLLALVAYFRLTRESAAHKMGLIVGAVVGCGFGILEAQWVHNMMFAGGWTWDVVASGGFMGLIGFWERFFIVAFHTASGALLGFGIGKGRIWQLFLIASVLHGVLNYFAVLYRGGLATAVDVELLITALSVAVSIVALWLRWRRFEAPPTPEEIAAPPVPDEATPPPSAEAGPPVV